MSINMLNTGLLLADLHIDINFDPLKIRNLFLVTFGALSFLMVASPNLTLTGSKSLELKFSSIDRYASAQRERIMDAFP